MENIFQPFLFLRLRHAELGRYWVLAILSGLGWVALEVVHWRVTGTAIGFFSQDGVMSSIATAFSALVGVYFGLAGVVVATPSPWLDETIIGSPRRPDDSEGSQHESMTRRAFFGCLLVYCAATSTIIVFSAALLTPVGAALGRALLSPPLAGAVSAGAGAVVVTVTSHVLLASFLGFRFLSRSAGV